MFGGSIKYPPHIRAALIAELIGITDAIGILLHRQLGRFPCARSDGLGFGFVVGLTLLDQGVAEFAQLRADAGAVVVGRRPW